MKNFNRALIIKILPAVLAVCIVVVSVIFLVNATINKNQSDVPQVEYVHVYYSYDENCCEFKGESFQSIIKGGDATVVTIKPKLGYRFLGWVDADGNQKEYFDTDKLTRHDKNIQDSFWIIAKFEGPITSDVKFYAKKGGTVEGKLKQTVLYGGKGERVTAIADEGYRFVKWSDGETEATRENFSLCYLDEIIYAEFERYSRKFEFVYNGGVAETGETEIEITLDNIDEVTFPVPERENCEFEGWYSDWHHEIKVSDNNGQLLVGIDWFINDGLYYSTTNPEGYLYAKWSTKKELPTYKILMIYVTEVHGNFTYWSSPSDKENIENVAVDYIMTEKHRKICNILTGFMSKYLNAIFNETVRFQVDEYYTTEPISENMFLHNYGDWSSGPDVMSANGIQETKEIIEKYDSVITSFSLCGYENDFKLTGGVGGSAHAYGKYATIVLDRVLKKFEDTDISNLINYSLDQIFFSWESSLDAYIHEFIHTVEGIAGIMDNIGLHSALRYAAKKFVGDNPHPYNVYLPFLLNKFKLDNGEYLGIPHEFWLSYSN